MRLYRSISVIIQYIYSSPHRVTNRYQYQSLQINAGLFKSSILIYLGSPIREGGGPIHLKTLTNIDLRF